LPHGGLSWLQIAQAVPARSRRAREQRGWLRAVLTDPEMFPSSRVIRTGYDALVALVTPAGTARLVASDLAFPNGMAITEDGATLIVAESHGNRLTAFDIGPEGGLGRRPNMGGYRGRPPGRNLPGRRGRRLVRGRRKPALRAGARGWRGSRHRRTGPRCLLLHA
jgi:hypothetical protein